MEGKTQEPRLLEVEIKLPGIDGARQEGQDNELTQDDAAQDIAWPTRLPSRFWQRRLQGPQNFFAQVLEKSDRTHPTTDETTEDQGQEKDRSPSDQSGRDHLLAHAGVCHKWQQISQGAKVEQIIEETLSEKARKHQGLKCQANLL